jgi:hypothetical protein
MIALRDATAIQRGRKKRNNQQNTRKSLFHQFWKLPVTIQTLRKDGGAAEIEDDDIVSSHYSSDCQARWRLGVKVTMTLDDGVWRYQDLWAHSTKSYHFTQQSYINEDTCLHMEIHTSSQRKPIPSRCSVQLDTSASSSLFHSHK